MASLQFLQPHFIYYLRPRSSTNCKPTAHPDPLQLYAYIAALIRYPTILMGFPSIELKRLYVDFKWTLRPLQFNIMALQLNLKDLFN